MSDARTALAVVALILALLGLSQVCAGRVEASHGIVEGDYCNARDAKRVPWTDQAKAQTRERVDRTAVYLGASPIIRAFHQMIVCREAYCGEASVRHRKGQDADGRQEDGLGPHGLSLRWHHDKWPGEDEDPAFCTPEVSTIVAHEIFWRAATRYGADSVLELQAVYAGSTRCVVEDKWAWLEQFAATRWLRGLFPGPERECFPVVTAKMEQGVCRRMAARGYNCHALIRAEDLGKRVPLSERRAVAMELAARR